MAVSTVLCSSQFFSSWGDRMWTFAVGLYLVKLTPDSLRLSAIYGLVVASTVVLFAPAVGSWVDNNRRLKVVRALLVLQNFLVIACAIVILLLLYLVSRSTAVVVICQAVIILTGAAANLASEGMKIAIGKDWVVVVANGDKSVLASLNSKLRRINLVCAVLAPVGVGLLMTVISNTAGIIFVCSWNVISMFSEYYLLLKVYKSLPQLATKASLESDALVRAEDEALAPLPSSGVYNETVVEQPVETCNVKVFHRLSTSVSGWSVYYKQNVFLAGLALAFLYLTVLGFSTITTGYAYTQKLSEFYVSLCYGMGALVGVGGTYLFPLLRLRFGLIKTGLISFFMQWSMLLLCLGAVWSPGSPSSLIPGRGRNIATPTLSSSSVPTPLWSAVNSQVQFTATALPSTTSHTLVSNAVNSSAAVGIELYTPFINVTSSVSVSNIHPTVSIQSSRSPISTTPPVDRPKNTTASDSSFNYTSIIMLMIGLVLSRAGLWITDLAITQLQQENVLELERGIVGGVQTSLNSLLDLLHFVLTILLPEPHQFGILVVISVGAVSLAYLTFVCFYMKHGGESQFAHPPEKTSGELLANSGGDKEGLAS